MQTHNSDIYNTHKRGISFRHNRKRKKDRGRTGSEVKVEQRERKNIIRIGSQIFFPPLSFFSSCLSALSVSLPFSSPCSGLYFLSSQLVEMKRGTDLGSSSDRVTREVKQIHATDRAMSWRLTTGRAPEKSSSQSNAHVHVCVCFSLGLSTADYGFVTCRF